ncbi:unnamed protein product [Adineta ricciae]|uniref:ADP ribosyltransferase domain-containing protein n=1 Tax=Adineta ricciae TaxID=249248 RepID=A0A814N4Z3_ADIRI|nr:unnamed protein product [Adineta ricciae]
MNAQVSDNKESITLIWFDPTIGSHEDHERTKQRLREINDYVVFHIELDPCIAYIQTISKEKVFLVTSGAHALELLTQVHELPQVDSIFVFCMKKPKYEYLRDAYPKIVNIFTDRAVLCASILEQVSLLNKQLAAFSFFDQNQRAIKDLSKRSAEFLWFKLFNDVILRLPHNLEAKQEMIDACRHYYRGNFKEQTLIDEFERDYQPEQAITWYSKQSFVYKLINKALRSEDIDLLHTFRYFICDLSNSLKRERGKFEYSGETSLTVYRGAHLTKKDFDNIRDNEGKLISTNGFLSTSRSRERALRFAQQTTKRTDVVPVLYVIQCPVRELDESFIFADIMKLSVYPKEQEVLFDLSAAFKINSVQKDGTIWIINLTASNEAHSIVKEYLELQRKEIQEKSAAILLGRLMCNMGQYDKSLQYFRKLLADPNGEDVAWIEFNIGRAFVWKCDWFAARECFDKVYARMMQNKPPRVKDSAAVLRSIGVTLYKQGAYDEALKYYRQALAIQEEFYPDGHCDTAWILNCIGSVFRAQNKYERALKYYQHALSMQKKFLPSDHVDIAWNLNNIGSIYQDQEKYEDALSHHQCALNIQEKIYPDGHAGTAYSLASIAAILLETEDYEKSLDLYRRALNMQQKFYPIGHVDVAGSLHGIGLVYFGQQQYDRALEYFEKSLEMRERFLPPDHLQIAESLTAIGNTYKELHDTKAALKVYECALAIYRKIVPRTHPGREKTEECVRRLRGNN